MSAEELREANYRPGSDAEHCGNCHFFDKLRQRPSGGICSMFAVVVQESMVCDKWRGNAQVR